MIRYHISLTLKNGHMIDGTYVSSITSSSEMAKYIMEMEDDYVGLQGESDKCTLIVAIDDISTMQITRDPRD